MPVRLVDDALTFGATIAGWCTSFVVLVRRGAAAAWSDDARPIFLAFALGLLLVAVSYFWYTAAAPPPTPPSVDGAGEVFVDDSAVAVVMHVDVTPDAPHVPERWPIRITLAFRAVPDAPPRARPVGWALVLYDDARLASIALPPGAALDGRSVGSPPFDATDPTLRKPVQVVHGTTYLTVLGNSAGAAVVSGELEKEVFTQSGPRQSLSLPRYGRTELNTAFSFATAPDAFDIGLPGDWRPPSALGVQIDAGPNGPGERIDSASPDVDDPASLTWRSEEGIRVNLLRTNLADEAAAQRTTFVLGAVVGAGAASVLTGVERLLTLRRRAGRGTAASVGPADRPAPAGPDPES